MSDVVPDDVDDSFETDSDTDIAVVGMAGRFPGAPDVDALWRRVADGDDCLVTLSRDELLAQGVPPHTLDDPDYVRRAGVLDDLEAFDAGFFGVGKRDAAIMDPQHRHFMECCWEALETSGHVPDTFDGAIGLFAGCGFDTYMLYNLLTNESLVQQVGMFLLRHTANDKDFLATTVSYRLDLRGPSVNVQTACSTSLVAVHLAVQSLLSFECDIAIAGGSTIQVPHRVGYTYQEGEVLTPGGVCRAFDERSDGTVLTNGAGAVALRRLSDAIGDRDPILAVIKGSAINNDGQRKVGYLAPSVDGHADVVKEALAVAGLSAREIQLLEAHGTGTSVGDPIEVAALTEAFRATTPDVGFCRLVSTKPNIGHLDTAAGVASLIKVIQAMRHETLPPLANHTAPSPLLDIERTPFVLSAEPTPWPGRAPRRAGVSSLGVGGTNAHVVVEEAPTAAPTPAAAPEQLIALSATDAATLEETARRLADALEGSPAANLADVAFTLARGRRAMAQRRVVVATDTMHAIDLLRDVDRNRVASARAPDAAPKVAFMFPGGGAHYVGMAAGFDERFDVFHAAVQEGVTLLRTRHEIDLEPLLRPDADADSLRKTTVSLPAVFLTSVALARQWMAWGVEPAAFVGHSLGEYSAAHLAGVLSLEGALDLIVARARLIDRVSGSGAAMLAVPLPVDEVRPLLGSSLSVATVNADDECVIAGPLEDVELLAKRVTTDEVVPTLIPIDAAGHSSLLDPILPEFLEAVRAIDLAPPQLSYLSNLTGTWITDEQATDPQYWVDHLRHTVRFADCLRTVLADGPMALIEVGPGHSLSSYSRRQESRPVAAIPALRHPNQDVDDTAYGLLAVGRAWMAGIDVDLATFAGADRRRLRLPGYPFRREHHWIEPGSGSISAPVGIGTAPSRVDDAPAPAEPRRITDVADTFWVPVWHEQPASPLATPPVGPWLVVADGDESFTAAIVAALGARGADEVDVVHSAHPEDFAGHRSIVLVGPTSDFDTATGRWMTAASAAARALASVDDGPTLLAAVTRGATAADGPPTAPIDAMALGVVRTARREYLGMRTSLVDLDPAPADDDDAAAAVAAATLVTEWFESEDELVAHRGPRRLVPSVERQRVAPVADDSSLVRTGGRYLVTGGLGDVGFALTSWLATRHRADLAVVTSRAVPNGADRDEWFARHAPDDPTTRRICRLAELESMGTTVVSVAADLADPQSVRDALDEAESRLGPLDGVIHAAGELRDRPIELATPEDDAVVLGAKARGATVLVDELRRRGTELLVLISSTSTLLVPEGQASYIAANSVLDALAGDHGELKVRTIDFGVWAERGAAAVHRAELGIEPGERVDHPVLSQLVVERTGDVHVHGTLRADHQWVVDEHRTSDGVALLPGTGHLELYLAAAARAGLEGRIAGVTVLEPLVVPDGAMVTVRVTLAAPDGDERRWVRLESDGGGTEWRLHSEAELVALAPPSIAVEVPVRANDAVDVDVLARPSSLMRFGPRWQSVAEAWRDGDEVAGRLELPDPYRQDLDAWAAHPALVDVATTFGMVLGRDPERLYVPIGYDEVTSHGALPASPWVRARLDGEPSDDLLRLDIELGDDEGTVLLAIEGLALRPIVDSEALAVTGEHDTAPAEPSHRVPRLMAVAARHGIVADEGPEMLDRLLASGRDRLVASSIELDDLLAVVAPATRPAADGTGPAPARAGTSVRDVIRDIWVELLGVADIGDDDDFFDAGGHSLIAIRMMSRIHKQLGVKFQLTTMFDAPTIAALAAEVLKVKPDLDAELAASATASGRPAAMAITEPVDAPHRALVAISTAGDSRPFFVVHGAGGNVMFLWTLARAMSGTRPLYGFQAHGVDGADMPDPSIEVMAERYVTELRADHDGPYLLGGYSGGGIVAFEMARQLQALGEQVERVVLFDSPVPGEETVPRAKQWANLARNLRLCGLEELKPYFRRRAREIARRWAPALAQKAGRDDELASAARQIGAVDVEASGFVDLYYYFSAAASRYRMRPLDVDVVLVKADRVWPVHPYDYHWHRYVRGRVDVVTTPGDHWAMFYPENVPYLAEVLMPLLEHR
jgi:acyl transferase domain-containing protein/thioesterase domain-containing protein/acyl carrier protein